jgi:hypothetical protein
MTPQSVEQARAAFRERHITEHYSGWLTIPLTFLYANLSEYLGHKGPMHHKTRFLGQIFERHTICDYLFGTVYRGNDQHTEKQSF